MAASLVPVPHESKPLVPSNDAFASALYGAKVDTCHNEDLAAALRYAMALIGLRAANMPTQVEFDFIKTFIRKNYPGHTVAEVHLAFDLAVKGELELGPDGAKCFENFSCEYIGRIMTAYRQWASKKFRELPALQPDTALLDAPKDVEWTNEWAEIVNCAKAGRIEKAIVIAAIYDWLVKTGEMNLTPEGKKHFVGQARIACMNDLQDQAQRRMLSMEERADLTLLKEDDWRRHERTKVRVQNAAKALAVKALAIEKAKNEGGQHAI